MVYHDYSIYTNSLLIGHMLSMVIMIDFFSQTSVAKGSLKAMTVSRGQGLAL